MRTPNELCKDIFHGYSVESTTYRVFVVDQQKVIESLSAQFNNPMLQAVKGEIDGIDDSYPSSGMAMYNTTHYFNEASQQGMCLLDNAKSASGPGRCKVNNGGCWHKTCDEHTFSACLDNADTKYVCPLGFKGDGVKSCEGSLMDQLPLQVLGEDTDPIAICQWSVSTSSGLINLDASADSGSDIGTAGFWSYERSDTLVRMSVNTSGEKSETLVRGRSKRDMRFSTGNVVVQKKLLMITSRLRIVIWQRFEEPRK
ncbi:hypothetical protein AgCh_016267 [Apium graveolens]